MTPYIKEKLFEFLKFKSVSTESSALPEMHKTANWLKDFLQEIGIQETSLFNTKNIPIVYGEKIIDEKKPTILIYGHYDVQPVEPIALWHTDPFEPQIINQKIYARGSADDKGQVMMMLSVIKKMIDDQSLPCNIKILIEGEEEIGSNTLPLLLKEHKDMLRSDIIVIADNAMLSMETPSLDISCRGLANYQITLSGSKTDLHSGTYGGAVGNPVLLLCKMLSLFHDQNNRVTIPGFYDDVYLLDAHEKKEIERIPFDQEKFKDELSIKALWGEKDFHTFERIGSRPTFEINGIWGGYTQEGFKTVLPSSAHAKISMRLVAFQKKEKIEKDFESYIHAIKPPQVNLTLTPFPGGDPYILQRNHIGFKAAEKAIKAGFGKQPLITRGGGSIPIVSDFENILETKSVFLGFGLHDDNLHAPNEKFEIRCFQQGEKTLPYFFHYFTEYFSN